MKIAFIFSGQGAQKPGMLASIYDEMAAARATFDVLGEAMALDLPRLCFGSDQETLNRTEHTQPAVLAADLAAMAALNEMGVYPALCAGFSLGEYAALVCAGVVDLSEAGKLVKQRAQCMAQLSGGGMAAVMGMDTQRLEEICAGIMTGYVEPVNYNAPGQVVVAGDQAGLDSLKMALSQEKARVMPLAVSGAFHSRLMKPAAQAFRPALDAASFAPPALPVVCNTTAQPFYAQDNWPDTLERQLCSPVRWEQSIRQLVDMGAEAFVECGPGKVLTKLNKRICPDIPSYAVEDLDTLHAAVENLRRT